MDGFQWTLKRQSSCLNFYFPTWKLDSCPKFVAAMVCVITFGIITEGIGRLRHNVNKKARQASNATQLNNLWYLQTLLQGANALMAYVLMLATMTYSLEILCCVITGLVFGYFLFGGDLYNHAGSVCCQFLEDEEDGGTVATLTGALLHPNRDNEDEVDSARRRNEYQSTDGANGGEDSCCTKNGNGNLNQQQAGLLSEVA
jgi:hypothetical protein